MPISALILIFAHASTPHLVRRIRSSISHLPAIETFSRMDKTCPHASSKCRRHRSPGLLDVVASKHRLAQTPVPASYSLRCSQPLTTVVGPQCGEPSPFGRDFRTLFVRSLPPFALDHLLCSPFCSACYLSPKYRTSPHEHISFPPPFPSA